MKQQAFVTPSPIPRTGKGEGKEDNSLENGYRNGYNGHESSMQFGEK